jgi:HAMP domain-containing protein
MKKNLLIFTLALFTLLGTAAVNFAAQADESRNLMAERTAAAQKELRPLFDDLQRMRNDRMFHELGFSSKHRFAADWKAKVEAWRAKTEPDDNIAGEVRAAAGALLQLGLEWQRSKGAMTDMAKWHLEMVNNALNWKLPE